MDEEPHHLTPAHLHAFGHIVSAYATVEHGLKLIIVGLAGIRHEGLGLVVLEPYSALDLTNVITSIIMSCELPDRIQGADCRQRM